MSETLVHLQWGLRSGFSFCELVGVSTIAESDPTLSWRLADRHSEAWCPRCRDRALNPSSCSDELDARKVLLEKLRF